MQANVMLPWWLLTSFTTLQLVLSTPLSLSEIDRIAPKHMVQRRNELLQSEYVNFLDINFAIAQDECSQEEYEILYESTRVAVDYMTVASLGDIKEYPGQQYSLYVNPGPGRRNSHWQVRISRYNSRFWKLIGVDT